MFPGLKQTDGWKYMQEMLPAVLALWQGDYAHNGEFWQFPLSTSVPKPLQKPHPPLFGATSSLSSHQIVGELGMGLCSFTVGLPPEELAERLAMAKALAVPKVREQMVAMGLAPEYMTAAQLGERLYARLTPARLEALMNNASQAEVQA